MGRKFFKTFHTTVCDGDGGRESRTAPAPDAPRRAGAITVAAHHVDDFIHFLCVADSRLVFRPAREDSNQTQQNDDGFFLHVNRIDYKNLIAE